MGRGLNRWLLAAVLGGGAWIAFSPTVTGDWEVDTAPAVRALADGHVSAYLSAKAAMGPLATLVQTPFAALGSTPLSEYRWACLPCLLAAAALGLYLASIARRRGAAAVTQLLIAFLVLANPLTFAAIEMGHPEEVLTTALVVGAVAVACAGHGVRAGLLLGLAIASKQWAVIAILPVLLVLPGARWRSGLTAAGVLALLTLPGLIAAPGSFMQIQGNAASGGAYATIWCLWYPLSPVQARDVGHGLTAHLHQLPGGVESLSHPLIVASIFLVPLALCLWRGRLSLDGEQAMALLALLALLRCVLDPVDNAYYHLPLLVALFGWDAVSGDRLPLRGLAATALALFFWEWSRNLGDTYAFNAAYLAVLLTAAALIVASLAKRPQRSTLRGRSAAPAPG